MIYTDIVTVEYNQSLLRAGGLRNPGMALV